MSSSDKLRIEILPDGTIKTTSDRVSAANHDNAEQFLKAVARDAGGETVREKRTDVKAPAHVHSHEHSHEHEHHH